MKKVKLNIDSFLEFEINNLNSKYVKGGAYTPPTNTPPPNDKGDGDPPPPPIMVGSLIS